MVDEAEFHIVDCEDREYDEQYEELEFSLWVMTDKVGSAAKVPVNNVNASIVLLCGRCSK